MSSYPPTMPTFSPGLLVKAADHLQPLADGTSYLLGSPRAGQPRRPFFHLAQTVAQSIPASTSTALLFDSELADTDGGHSTTSTTSRYTCQTTGTYVLWADYVSSNGPSSLGCHLKVNGSTAYWYDQRGAAAGVLASAITISGPVALAVGDYVEVMAFHDAATAKNTATGAFVSRLAGMWIGP